MKPTRISSNLHRKSPSRLPGALATHIERLKAPWRPLARTIRYVAEGFGPPCEPQRFIGLGHLMLRPRIVRRADGADLTIIVVSYNTASCFPRLLDALYAASGDLRLQVIAVDNASADESVDCTAAGALRAVQVITNSTNVGFGRANNQAMPFVTGRHVLLLNTDAFVAPDALREDPGVHGCPFAECGVLGVRLVGRDGALQPSCRFAPNPWNLFLHRTGLKRLFPRRTHGRRPSVGPRLCARMRLGARLLLLVRREVLERVGLFDPRFFLYYEEVDHCRRVQRAGWKVVFYPHTSVVHLGRGKRQVGQRSHGNGAADLGAADRKRAAVLPQASRRGRPVACVVMSGLADSLLALKVACSSGAACVTSMRFAATSRPSAGWSRVPAWARGRPGEASHARSASFVSFTACGSPPCPDTRRDGEPRRSRCSTTCAPISQRTAGAGARRASGPWSSTASDAGAIACARMGAQAVLAAVQAARSSSSRSWPASNCRAKSTWGRASSSTTSAASSSAATRGSARTAASATASSSA